MVEEVHNGSGVAQGAIIQESKLHLSTFVSCNIVHQFRSSNVESHDLTKHTLTFEAGHHVWLGQSGGIHFVRVNIVVVE